LCSLLLTSTLLATHFLCPESILIHAVIFLLFSGQKFALLEEKVVISSLLRKYRVEAVDRREDLTLMGELILRPKHGLRIKIFPRKS
jgi:hypothetical protein